MCMPCPVGLVFTVLNSIHLGGGADGLFTGSNFESIENETATSAMFSELLLNPRHLPSNRGDEIGISAVCWLIFNWGK